MRSDSTDFLVDVEGHDLLEQGAASQGYIVNESFSETGRERDVQYQDLLVRVCSWNVGESLPASNLLLREWLLGHACQCTQCTPEEAQRTSNQKHFLPHRHINRPSVVAIGLQEVDMSFWAMLLGCCTSFSAKGLAWSERIADALDGYTLLVEEQLMGLLLLVFVLDELSVEQEVTVETRCVTAGMCWGLCGNKGATSARLAFNNPRTGTSTALCFINCHLAAKKVAIERRNLDHDKILDTLRFSAPPHTALDHDYVFWFGDLNYRLETSSENLMKIVTPSACHNEREDVLWSDDQLLQEIRKKRVFNHFKEPKIKWCPTYKFLKQPGAAYCTKREPSYCDRILYYSYTSGWVRSGANLIDDVETEAGACSESPLLAERSKARPVPSINEELMCELSSTSPTTPQDELGGSFVGVDEAGGSGGGGGAVSRQGDNRRADRGRDSPLLQCSSVAMAERAVDLQKVSCLEYATVHDIAGYDFV